MTGFLLSLVKALMEVMVKIIAKKKKTLINLFPHVPGLSFLFFHYSNNSNNNANNNHH